MDQDLQAVHRINRSDHGQQGTGGRQGEVMRQAVELVQAERLQSTTKEYQEGIQAMWEARWRQRGAKGQACWLLCHGSPPPAACPWIGSDNTPGRAELPEAPLSMARAAEVRAESHQTPLSRPTPTDSLGPHEKVSARPVLKPR